MQQTPAGQKNKHLYLHLHINFYTQILDIMDGNKQDVGAVLYCVVSHVILCQLLRLVPVNQKTNVFGAKCGGRIQWHPVARCVLLHLHTFSFIHLFCSLPSQLE